MFIGHFEFDVEPERQDDFLKAVRERIKPHWLATGKCWDYNVYQEWDAKAGKSGNHFIKTQIMEGNPGPRQRTPEDQEVIDVFYSFAKNVAIRTFVKKV
jgi:hypothetical protein